MSDYLSSPLGALDGQERLLSPVFKGSTGKAGVFGFRGEIALKLAESTAGEKRPPEVKTDQVFMVCDSSKIPFFGCYVDSLAHLEEISSVFGDSLSADGKYFVFAGNVDLLKKYTITLKGIPFYVLPLDEGTVYNELLDLFYLEKGDLKKLDMDAKLVKLSEAAATFRQKFPDTPWEQALKEMGPVKVYENRPV